MSTMKSIREKYLVTLGEREDKPHKHHKFCIDGKTTVAIGIVNLEESTISTHKPEDNVYNNPLYTRVVEGLETMSEDDIKEEAFQTHFEYSYGQVVTME